MVTWHNTWLINTILKVKDDEFFISDKFWFSAIIYAKVIANPGMSIIL